MTLLTPITGAIPLLALWLSLHPIHVSVTEIEFDEKLLKELSYQATGDLTSMAAFFGGVAAQELCRRTFQRVPGATESQQPSGTQ